MRAAPGAIERVRIDPETKQPNFQVIGEERWSDDWQLSPDAELAAQPKHLASGVCGSGIIEAVAEMFTAGVIKSNGRFALNKTASRYTEVHDAAAFIIAEYLGIPYLDVVKAAAIPAFVSYFALFYITHLEASKLGMSGLPKAEIPAFAAVMKRGFYYLIPLVALIYELIVMRHTPKLAAFNAIVVLMVIIMVKEIASAIRNQTGLVGALKRGLRTIGLGLNSGSRNMLSVAIATATAGITTRTAATNHGPHRPGAAQEPHHDGLGAILGMMPGGEPAGTDGLGRVLDVGTGTGTSVRELIAAAREVTGVDVPVQEADRRPGDPPMLYADPKKLKDGINTVAGEEIFDEASAVEVLSLQLTAVPERPSARLGRPIAPDLEALFPGHGGRVTFHPLDRVEAPVSSG